MSAKERYDKFVFKMANVNLGSILYREYKTLRDAADAELAAKDKALEEARKIIVYQAQFRHIASLNWLEKYGKDE